jgi:Tol biopolymer transport system component
MRLAVLTGTDRKLLLDDVAGDIRTPTYASDGWIVYTRQKTEQALYAVPFSLDSLAVTGPPINLVGHATAPTVSVDGTLAHRSGTWAMPTDLVLVDRTGRILASAGGSAADIRIPVFSPAGNRVAFAAYETATSDIRVRDLDRSTETRVSQPGVMNANPAWSPDGTRLVYTIGTLVANRVVLGQADGSGEPRTLAECDRPCRLLDWSADGSIVSWVSDGDLHWLKLDGQSAPVRVRTQEAEESVRLSPDLKYYAYSAVVSGRLEVFVRGFPTGEGRWQVSADGGVAPAWSRASRELYFVRGNALYAVPIEGGASFRAGMPVMLFDGDEKGVQLFRFTRPTPGYHPTPDGQRFVVARQAGASGSFITVVENWLNDLSARR